MSTSPKTLDLRMCQGTFDEQVERLFHRVLLSNEQSEKDLQRLFEDVTNTLEPHWPGCELFLLGSLIQGTALKNSDIDCFLQIPNQYMTVKSVGDMCKEAKDILNCRPDVFEILVAISHEHDVPARKITILHLPTSRECDLILVSPEVRSQLTKYQHLFHYLLHLDNRVLNMVVLVKYWANVHNIFGPYFRSHVITLMVIFYLQQLNVLPNVRSLQTSVPQVFYEIWNVAFEESKYLTSNKSSLRHLLMGFFTFFSAYKYEENVISVYAGRSIARKSFTDVSDLPEDFELYKDNLRRKLCKPFELNTPMCVQDAFKHTRNTACGITSELFQDIKQCFISAAKLCESEAEGTFLRAILTNKK